MTEKYGDYIEKWLGGIGNEILFWKEYMQDKGGIYKKDFLEVTRPNREFAFEEEIPEDKLGKRLKFVDVGAGPFSDCGTVSTKVKLEVTAIDPLADVYNSLKKKYGLDNGIRIRMGFVECLDTQFAENEFDIVYMRNALDHCFDAVMGIYQLLYICRTGGKVILKHTENEAEREGYQGFHQWNLSLDNPEKSFIIWREDQRIDAVKIFREYADIELYPGEGEWPANKVILTKRRQIQIPPNLYNRILLEKEHEFLMNKLLAEVYLNNDRTENRKFISERLDQIEQEPEQFQRKLRKLGIEQAVIYGMGMHGERVYNLLKRIGIPVKGIIDMRKMTVDGIHTVSVENYEDSAEVSAIILCVSGGKEELKKVLILKGIEAERIYEIEKLV